MTFAEFWTDYLWPLIIIVAESLLLLVVLLVAIAYVLLADRKIWAAVQIRRGPNVVGPWGLFQSFADLLKFVFKEPTIPAGANKALFLLAPLVFATLALAAENHCRTAIAVAHLLKGAAVLVLHHDHGLADNLRGAEHAWRGED